MYRAGQRNGDGHPGSRRVGPGEGALPWLSDEYASDWARTAQSGGTGGGEAFIPEVGDEVLVGFEHGHLDRPYVLAGLYNGKDRPGGGPRAPREAPLKAATSSIPPPAR